jgi:hypothetical protein
METESEAIWIKSSLVGKELEARVFVVNSKEIGELAVSNAVPMSLYCSGFRSGEDSVSKGMTGFYRKLYKLKKVDLEERDFYDYCLKLLREAREQMELELSEASLLAPMNTCADSAPRPNGISYTTYKKLWSIARSFILNSCKHSSNTGVLPAPHIDSVITLLPKEGKDTKDIKNWRPITSSN